MRLRLIWWEGSESLRMNQNSSLQSLIETLSKQIKYYDSNLKFWSRIRISPWIKWSLISKQSFSFSSLDGPHRPWLDRWVVGRWLFWFKVLSNSLLSEWLPGIGEKLTLFPVSFFILRCWNCEAPLVGLSIRKCRILIAEYGKGELHLSEKGSL